MFGNKNSVKELYNSYSNDVFHYSLSILKDYEDAKDAVQEVFIQYLKKEDAFRGECSYKTWLLTITRNYCFKKLNNKSTRMQEAGQEFPAAYDMNIEANISLHDALEGLSPDEYEIIYLREYAGYSYQEIAEILKISLDNVKIKLFRVRQRLKKYLK
jgi:RNA polymerase sigma-70 factor (ECF subfamily)